MRKGTGPSKDRAFVLCNAIKLTMDALGIHAEEGRIWRRYASGRSHTPLIRRFPNRVIGPLKTVNVP